MSVLDRILEDVRTLLEPRKAARPLADLQRAAEAAPQGASFRAALTRPGTSLIAEAKQRSPSLERCTG